MRAKAINLAFWKFYATNLRDAVIANFLFLRVTWSDKRIVATLERVFGERPSWVFAEDEDII